MHLIITDAWLAKSKPLHLSGAKLLLAGLLASLLLMLTAVGLYHLVFLKGAREGWPVIGSLVKLVVKDEFAQRDRFMRENLDAMAKKVGEMQAKILQLEQLTERVSQLAGVPIPVSAKVAPGTGGVLIGERPLSLEELQKTIADLEAVNGQKIDLLTLMESRLFDQKVAKLLVPTAQPVPGSHLGSAFGWRIDPITGRSALHSGLDFQAEPGTPILAAAGGVVVVQEYHAGYGNMVEIDHGNNLITRYAHALEVFVKKGDLIKRGQKIATVGSTGRSTGPHLHFEVIADGVQQDPQKFLTSGGAVLPPSESPIAGKTQSKR
jgi:murein DD-endopeptidase MepM/ murein hydrolase activator NlpD